MPLNLTDFLVWLGTGGSVLAVSFIAERIDAFQKLTANAKQWIMFIVCALLAGGSTAVLNYVPKGTLDLIAPYYASTAAVFGLIFLAKSFHFFDKKSSAPIDNSKG